MVRMMKTPHTSSCLLMMKRCSLEKVCKYNSYFLILRTNGQTGDYQFDIYRFMRNHVSSGLVEEWIDWNVYMPRTNLFWLHYLTNILLCKSGLSRPAARGRYAASETEQKCFKQLEVIAKRIDPKKKTFGKQVTLESAQDLVEWAVCEEFLENGI